MRVIGPGVLILLVGCSSGEKAPAKEPSSAERSVVPTSRHYSRQQMQRLTMCVAHGNVLYHVILQKKTGTTLEQALERLRQADPPVLDENLEALIQDVYAQPDDETSEILESFYSDFCIPMSAEIPEEQAAVAQRCLRSTYIAMEAYAARAAGLTEEQTKEHFESTEYAAPIVARAYAFDGPNADYGKHGELVTDEWFRCFAEAE